MKEITLTAIFEGTIYSIDEPNTHLHQVLFHDCEGTRIFTKDEIAEHLDATHLKMGFNGCGIEKGTKGLLFGVGIEEQSEKVAAVVKELIKAGYKVRLNGIGLSRGGVAATLLAKKLGHIDPYHLETNLLLLDPVPGNLAYTPYVDFFNFSLANRSLDLSHSKNLSYVEALYPYLEVGEDTDEALDKFLAHFHIPLRPTYPKHCEVREEVILGAHLRAFQDLEKNNDEKNLRYGVDLIPIIKKLSKTIMYQFLSRVGSLSVNQSNVDTSAIAAGFEQDREKWKGILANIIANIVPKNRRLHSQDGSQITVSNSAPYLNKTHRELIDVHSNRPEDLCLKVIPERPYTEKKKLSFSKELLLDLIKTLEDEMTLTSKQNKKGQLLKGIKESLQGETFFNDEELSFILRDVIAIVLQRDRYSFSFYSTTTSGLALVKILNKPEYNAMHQLVQFDDKAVCYADLIAYALGRDESSHFNSQDKDTNLSQIEQHKIGEDGYRMLI